MWTASKKRKIVSLGSQSTLDAFRRGTPTTKVFRESPPDSCTTGRINQIAVEMAEPPSDHIEETTVTAMRTKRPFVAAMRTQDAPMLTFTDIREFEISESSREAFFEEKWQQLRTLLRILLHKKELRMSLQLGYEACSTVCGLQKAEDLYNRLSDEFSIYIKETAVKLRHMYVHAITVLELRVVSWMMQYRVSTDVRQFVQLLEQVWTQLSENLVLLRSVFIELDRQYLIRKTGYSSLIELGQRLFRNIVMGSDLLRNTAISEILKIIEDERNDIPVNEGLLRNLIGMLSKLDLYAEYFEPALVEDTRVYYEAEANKNIGKMPISEYLIFADKRLKQESVERIEKYLEKSSRHPLAQVVNAQFVRTRLNFIITHGFDDLVDRDEKESLRILYGFLLENDGLVLLRKAFADYIKKRGKELIQDPKRDQGMILSLLAYKAKLDDIISHCFADSDEFHHVEKESFESFINSRRNRPAELLAKYIDIKLRASTKKSDDEDFEGVIDRVLPIFRYLQDRDTFEAFYKRHLCRRLLLGRSISNDAEKLVLSKLKDECGAGFTKNLEAMFKDIEVSADMQTQFAESDYYPKDSTISFRVTVLAQGIWPTYALLEVNLPFHMMECQSAYEAFYASKKKGHRLTWQNFLASCIVKAYFPNGSKEIQISLLQTVVLLLFNEKDTYSYAEIAARTNMDQKELKRVLASLACGQHQLLLKERGTQSGSAEYTEITSSDTFTYNSNFTSSNVRIKINVAQQDQVGDERKATERKVLVDRQHQLEAAIVRIMKSKKKIGHSDLMKELFLQIKFPLEASDIKKRIESLIDRDYLSRDEDDGNTYIYR
ncbi:Cullin family-domain-containing protein [Dichotomocladium elegans]|nr:Cullin family-domain-containing protein [Dichotomocladium elegans]